jgi:hypothetical protein
MAWKRSDDADKRADEVLGIRDVKPDNPPKPDDERDSVGAAGEVTPTADRMGGMRQTKGATGIDMGAGGDGTDIEP